MPIPAIHSPLDGRPDSGSDVLCVFDALSRHGRLAVFRRIVRAGASGVDAATLTRELRTTGSALTLHLRRLADAGLIRVSRERGGCFVADLERLRSALAVFDEDLAGS